jgi:uncharacterized protein YidB (DUF937 family)
MGLLDNIIGELSSTQGANAGAHQDLLQGVMGMVAKSGGLSGLVSMFEQNGLGHIISSWISTGQNLPISAAQIMQVLGSGQLGQLAAKVGLSPQAASAGLAQLLPTLIDKLTPNGQIQQAAGGLLGKLAGILGGKQS